VVVSLNTPFDDRGRVDFASLERLVEYHLQEGAVGFLTTAQAGEVNDLTLPEKTEIVRCVKQQVKGRAKLIAGATAIDERESFALAKDAVRLDCEGVLAEVPAGRKQSPSGIQEFFRSFAAVGMPMLMIQDLDWNGAGLEVSLIADMFAAIEQFRCLKVEVTPAGPKYSAVVAATEGLLHISGGWAANQMLEALDRGVDAYIPSAMTSLYARVIAAFDRGDRKAATFWFYRMLPVLAFTRQHVDICIHFYKRLFHRLGLIRSFHVRKRTVPYDSYHASYGEELMRYLDKVKSETQGN